jgi:hypothetical protein
MKRVILALFVLITSCSAFSPRTPAAPSVGRAQARAAVSLAEIAWVTALKVCSVPDVMPPECEIALVPAHAIILSANALVNANQPSAAICALMPATNAIAGLLPHLGKEGAEVAAVLKDADDLVRGFGLCTSDAGTD